MNGYRAETLSSGIKYCAIHFSADESKGHAWEAEKSAGVPVREWKREMGMHDDIYDGQPVFADYSDVRHCPEKIRKDGIPIVPQSCYIGGWDGGLVPAFTLKQITLDFQIHTILEVVTEGDDPMETFVPKVQRAIEQRIPGRHDEIYHTGDPTIWNRTPGTGESSGAYAKRRFGIYIRPSSNIWEVRRSAVTWALTSRLDNGKERYIIDPIHCPVLRQGFNGAYQYEVSTRGDTTGAGRILTEPLKNGWSHVHDSSQYGDIAAKKFCEGKLNLR
jgi:hypothetical protein